MKSFLLSTLLPELDLRDAVAFARAYPHPWLLRESAPRPPLHTTGATLLMPTPATVAREGLALAIALEPARPGAAQVTLGRGHACDVELEDGTLSQLHCVFFKAADSWHLEDVGSTNGTWVDGTRIQAAQVLLSFHHSSGLWRRLEAEALRP